jgi:hypothetical protein
MRDLLRVFSEKGIKYDFRLPSRRTTGTPSKLYKFIGEESTEQWYSLLWPRKMFF